MNRSTSNEIVIVGGGFAGISAALSLAKRASPKTKIRLISKISHFEYHAALYRVVTGRSPLEVCIPLSEIFSGQRVEVVEDEIVGVSLKKKVLTGKHGSTYNYDYLVLALGSETSYYEIPGLKKLSYGFKSIPEALELKRHLHEEMGRSRVLSKEEKVRAMHLVVVGGGASGSELAGELAVYTEGLAKSHGIDPAVVTIDLIQSNNRLLPDLPEAISEKVELRLRKLGVNIFLNRRVVKEEIETVYLKDMRLNTKTVIWTAGVVINSRYKKTKGLKIGETGNVEVNKYLSPKKYSRVFILGDAAQTPYSGMAQTAIYDGEFVANNILRIISGNKMSAYSPKPVSYAIPVGPGWAAVLWRGFKFYGRLGWFMRKFADFRFFASILPLSKALDAFRHGKTVCESCGICDLKFRDIDKVLI